MLMHMVAGIGNVAHFSASTIWYGQSCLSGIEFATGLAMFVLGPFVWDGRGNGVARGGWWSSFNYALWIGTAEDVKEYMRA